MIQKGSRSKSDLSEGEEKISRTCLKSLKASCGSSWSEAVHTMELFVALLVDYWTHPLGHGDVTHSRDEGGSTCFSIILNDPRLILLASPSTTCRQMSKKWASDVWLRSTLPGGGQHQPHQRVAQFLTGFYLLGYSQVAPGGKVENEGNWFGFK